MPEDQPWYIQRCHEWWRVEWHDTYDTTDFPYATQEQKEYIVATAVDVIGCAGRLRSTETLTRRQPPVVS